MKIEYTRQKKEKERERDIKIIVKPYILQVIQFRDKSLSWGDICLRN